jgi:hypothetical protein
LSGHLPERPTDIERSLDHAPARNLGVQDYANPWDYLSDSDLKEDLADGWDKASNMPNYRNLMEK